MIDEIGKYIYIINLFRKGEPFLNPQIFDIIKYCHKNRIYTSISTNGNYKPEYSDKIIDSKLDNILFYLDGSNPEVYNKYRVGGSFD